MKRADMPPTASQKELTPPGNNAPPDAQSADASATAAGSDWLRLFVLAAGTALLIGLCVLVSVPFLPAITWSVALAIIAWPLHRWVSRHIESPSPAAAVTTVVVVVVILVPALFVAYQLAREAGATAERIQGESAEGSLREKMAEVPVLREVAVWMERANLDPEQEVRNLVSAYTRDLTSLTQGSVAATIQFLVVVFILYYLFRDRATFLGGLRDLLPLSRAESDRVFTRAADSVHANLYATMVTSLIDATGGGLMFWLLGLPSPFLWGVVMFVLSVLPVVGAGLVWGPAAVFLALSGQWLHAFALVGWGFLFFLIVDNVIYVRLAGERMRMHEVPALIAFLGGLAVFGLSGMILGPAILAVTVAVLEVWRRRMTDAELQVAMATPDGRASANAADVRDGTRAEAVPSGS